MSVPEMEAAPSGAAGRLNDSQDDRLADLRDRIDRLSTELAVTLEEYRRDVEAAFPGRKG